LEWYRLGMRKSLFGEIGTGHKMMIASRFHDLGFLE
jgi:hypothetical protein